MEDDSTREFVSPLPGEDFDVGSILLWSTSALLVAAVFVYVLLLAAIAGRVGAGAGVAGLFRDDLDARLADGRPAWDGVSRRALINSPAFATHAWLSIWVTAVVCSVVTTSTAQASPAWISAAVAAPGGIALAVALVSRRGSRSARNEAWRMVAGLCVGLAGSLASVEASSRLAEAAGVTVPTALLVLALVAFALVLWMEFALPVSGVFAVLILATASLSWTASQRLALGALVLVAVLALVRARWGPEFRLKIPGVPTDAYREDGLLRPNDDGRTVEATTHDADATAEGEKPGRLDPVAALEAWRARLV